jgi:hypothetical protein
MQKSEKKSDVGAWLTALAYRGSIHLVAARLSDGKALPVALGIATIDGPARWSPNPSFRVRESLPRPRPQVGSVQDLAVPRPIAGASA